MKVLSFEAFVATLSSELDLSLPGTPDRDTDLVADLGFDSMLYVFALGVLDTLGAPVDDQAIAQAQTLGDLHHLYVVAVAAGADVVISQ